MPRQAKSVEFLNKLKDVLGIESNREFAAACGQYESNMSTYLGGTRVPGRKVLRDCVKNSARSIFGWEIHPLLEVELVPTRQRHFPNSGGVYVLYDSAGNVLYIGKAKSFRAEVWQTLGRSIPVGMRFGPNMKKSKPTISDLATYISLYEIDDARLRHNIEALLIRVLINQTHNSNIANFKTK